MIAQLEIHYPNLHRDPNRHTAWNIQVSVVHPANRVREHVVMLARLWCRANISAEYVLWHHVGSSLFFKHRDDAVRFKLGFQIPHTD